MSDNDRNQNEDGGLFSEDYETPKRENPYLRKNREKAKSEKSKPEKPKPEKPKREKPKREKPVPPAEPSDERPVENPAENPAEASAEGEGYVRKRTFSDWMFEHVKLIAAIATVLVVLALVLITDVVDVVEDLITQSQQADKEELTLTYIKGLSEKPAPITWSDLDKFRRDETRADGSVTWMIEVKGTAYEVWVSGVDTVRQPLYVYLYDMETGDRMILGKEDLDAFIEAHS